MSIKRFFPDTRPTLDLNFAATKRLDPRITYTRASTGTFVGSNGLVQSAAVNQARFEHNPLTGESLGLLVEEAKTNSLWPSEPTTATAKNTPGGTGNAWYVSDGTTASSSRNGITGLEVTINSTLDNNGYTSGSAANWGGIGGGGAFSRSTVANVSFFIHPLTWTGNIWLGRLPNDGNPSFAEQNFQLFNNGVYTGPSANVKAIFSDGTYWLHNISWTSLSTDSAQTQYLVVFTTTLGDNSKKFWTGGFQWEAGESSTSYIPTSGSTVTRAADIVSIAGTNFSSWYNQSAGTFFANYKRGPRSLMGIVTGSPDEYDSAPIADERTSRGFTIRNNAAEIFDAPSVAVGASVKQIGAYNVAGPQTSLCVNGRTIVSSASYSSAPTGITIGGTQTSNYLALNSSIARLTYYPARLPDAQFQALTAP